MKLTSLLKKVKTLEKKYYPSHMRVLNEAGSVRNILELCELPADDVSSEEIGHKTWRISADSSEIIIRLFNEGYAILFVEEDTVEVQDLAGTVSLREMFSLWGLVRSLERKFLELDARETTSFRIIKSLEKSGRISILSDNSWDWEGEVMHEIRAEIK
ncbi:MAG: hypothetical protein EOM62_11010 [Bacteroidia bacterium]|nr:hypothetical protein [Bacteroidia bacterium]